MLISALAAFSCQYLLDGALGGSRFRDASARPVIKQCRWANYSIDNKVRINKRMSELRITNATNRSTSFDSENENKYQQ
jgi:hypothetical protein